MHLYINFPHLTKHSVTFRTTHLTHTKAKLRFESVISSSMVFLIQQADLNFKSLHFTFDRLPSLDTLYKWTTRKLMTQATLQEQTRDGLMNKAPKKTD